MEEKTRLKAREYLLRSRIYRFLAALCALVGLLIFLIFYFKNIEGDIVKALSSVSTAVFLFLPFLPAFVLSWLSMRSESKFLAVMKEFKLLSSETEKQKTSKKK